MRFGLTRATQPRAAARSFRTNLRGLCALYCSILLNLLVFAIPFGFAQDKVESKKPPSEWDALQVDREAPLFKAVVDKKPLAEPLENPEEFNAFVDVVKHAWQQAPELMSRHSLRSVPLASLVSDEERKDFLRQLLHFEGTLIRLRTKEAPTPLQKAGIAELYEGSIKLDGITAPIEVIFTERPRGLDIEEKVSQPVAFDGYYFKLLAYPSKDQKGKLSRRFAPLLIGRTITLQPKPPAPIVDEAQLVKLPKNDKDYQAIEDKKPLAKRDENPGEFRAYGDAIVQARKFSPEILAKHSRRDVVYADLIEDIREQFLRELLHIEGTLVRLRKREAPVAIKDTTSDEIKDLYEGWILFDSKIDHPVVVIFTDLPEGVKLGEQLHQRIAFDGYYFKLFAYETKEKNKKGENTWRVAPLLIGRAPQLTDTDDTLLTLANPLIPMILAVIGLVVVAIITMTILFRRADRRVRQKTHEALTKHNPFDADVARAPPIQPGTAWDRASDPPSAN